MAGEEGRGGGRGDSDERLRGLWTDCGCGDESITTRSWRQLTSVQRCGGGGGGGGGPSMVEIDSDGG